MRYTYTIYMTINTRGEDPGLCTSNEEIFLKFYWKNMLDNFKRFFCSDTFGIRTSMDVLDSENKPGSVKIGTGSGAPGLTVDV